MNKIYIYTTYDIDYEDGSTKTYRCSTRIDLKESSLNTAFDQHTQKEGEIEKKIIKDQAYDLSQTNE